MDAFGVFEGWAGTHRDCLVHGLVEEDGWFWIYKVLVMEGVGVDDGKEGGGKYK